MTAIAKELDAKLRVWRPLTAQKVERLVAEIIALADRKTSKSKLPRKSASKDGDAFLTDKKVFLGKTPKDLAANHDRYLYNGNNDLH